jgi:hypothetical protein
MVNDHLLIHMLVEWSTFKTGFHTYLYLLVVKIMLVKIFNVYFQGVVSFILVYAIRVEAYIFINYDGNG